MSDWCYWTKTTYYQRELRKRARGELPEMESAKYITKLARRYLRKGDSILDAGCGSGHYLLSLQQDLDHPLSYTGLDITPQHIKNAKAIFKGKSNVRFVEGDVRSMPFADRQFSVTICANTIPHIPDARRALRELMRVTRNVLIVRMLVGDELLITKRAYSAEVDEAGEPLVFGYVNIYTPRWVRDTLDLPTGSVRILRDQFSPKMIGRHFSRHSKVGGSTRTTRVIDGQQFKGYLLLPWKVVVAARRLA